MTDLPPPEPADPARSPFSDRALDCSPHPERATSAVPVTTPGLQGTEMWLALIWLRADLLGIAGQLGYRPRGVHRPETAARISA